jgi:hypothetical protein
MFLQKKKKKTAVLQSRAGVGRCAATLRNRSRTDDESAATGRRRSTLTASQMAWREHASPLDARRVCLLFVVVVVF